MRDLFYHLNKAGIEVDISTFSKACKTRQDQYFCRIYAELMERLKRKNPATAQMLIPIDSTVITLTSKLFWEYGYHQVKLMNGINLTQGNPTECLIHFGQGHDALATNLEEMTNEEGSEIYRNRWQIEILWKFLKMHLKLDRLITKNINGVTIQIYMVLIAYLILQLMEIPAFYGNRLLDKFRYLQLELSRRCSIVHWSYDLLPEALV